ncbi:MAG: hypothetical protein ACKVPX_00435 [Myxococcaceae bacterium]
MRAPLGQLLLREGLVTPEQLRRALSEQGQWRARVGSTLLRMGLLDSDALARVLSLHYGVPAALRRDFERLSPAAFARIPRKLAEKHLAVPLTFADAQARLLSVALVDPTRMAAIDELAFAAGVRLSVSVAPETRILETLESRYGALADLAPWEASAQPSQAGVLPPPPAFSPAVVPLPPPPSALWLRGDEEGDTIGQALQSLDPTFAMSGPPSVLDPIVEDAWNRLMRAAGPGAGALPSLAPPLGPEPISQEFLLEDVVDAGVRPLSVTEAIGRATHAPSADEVGVAIVDYLRSAFAVGLVFWVREGHAQGVFGFGPRVTPLTLARLRIPLSAASCLRAAYSQRHAFAGTPPRDGVVVHTTLWNAVGAESAPREVLVVPILVQSHVVGLVYAHPGGGASVAPGRAEETSRLAAAAATALLRLGR